MDDARDRIRAHYARVCCSLELKRVSKIAANVGKGRVHSGAYEPLEALMILPEGSTPSPKRDAVVLLSRVEPPPPGIAWVRARTDLRTPDTLYAAYYVPYLGETEDKFNASQTLAKDLVQAQAETQEEYEADEPDENDLSDVEGLHPMDDSAPGERVALLSWERASKRVTIKEVVESCSAGESMQSLTKPIAAVLAIDDDNVARYFGNAKRREAMWQSHEKEVRFKEKLRSELLSVTKGMLLGTAASELKSDSISLLFCRQCYTFDCMQHGLDSGRPNIDLPDSTRTDSMPASHLRTVQERCRIVNPGICWLARGEAAGTYNAYPKCELSPCAKELVSALRENMGDDPCRLTEMVRVVDTYGSSRLSCLDVGLYLGSLDPLPRVRQIRNIRRSRTLVPTPEVKAMRGGRRLDYSPCDHVGPCTKQNCACVEKGVNCEKYCCCNHVRVSGDRTHPHGFCKRAHGGCSCKSASSCRTSNCVCFSSRRECDPDLCKSCGAGNAPGESRACGNSGLRLHSRYKTVCGRSSVHGWGVYALEFIPKGVLVGEYLGEIINQDEAERRGRVYDELNNSFLFNTTEQFAVDSTRLGSKLKYCNHSKNPNCEPRLMRVGGDVRVGIYSKQDIIFLEELFFDYGYGKSGPAWANEDCRPRTERDRGERDGQRRSHRSRARSSADMDGNDPDVFDVVMLDCEADPPGGDTDVEEIFETDAERRRRTSRRASLLAMSKLLRNS